jgi:hypothetical protein
VEGKIDTAAEHLEEGGGIQGHPGKFEQIRAIFGHLRREKV